MNDTNSSPVEIRQHQETPQPATTPPTLVPKYCTRETEEGVSVQVALPGVRREDLKLTLHESNLRIEATRGDQIPADWKTHRSSAAGARYELRVRLHPRLDGTRSSARCEHGVLNLEVPLREESKPRQIEVN